MKIVVFENEYESVKGAFEASKLLDFNNELEIDVCQSSQKFDMNKLNEYNAFFIDIDLALNSDLDGFSLIKKLIEIDKELASKIIILTGNNKIKENLNERGIDSGIIQTIIKPTNYVEISEAIEKCKL